MIIFEAFQILTRNSLYKQKYKNININNLRGGHLAENIKIKK